MHRRTVVLFLLAFVVTLAGCQGASEAAATGEAAGATTAAATAGRPGGDVMALAVGTLALDGTDNAITAAQAAELLPLWKAYRALLASDATAPQELAALVEQIRQGMAAEQQATLEAGLSPEEQAALLARHGIEMPAGGGMPAQLENMTEEERQAAIAERQAAAAAGGAAGPGMGREAGGAPPEGMPAGGPPAGGAAMAQVQAASGGGTAVQAGANTWATGLVEAVIAYLESIQ